MKLSLKFRFITLIAAALPAFGTSQEPDQLTLDGEQLSLETNPLSPILRSKLIDLPKPAEQWSSNWRGYVASWTIKDGQLMLARLEVPLRPDGLEGSAKAVPVNVLSRVFDGKVEVPAKWFSGTLVVPRGKVVKYMHMGYGSTFERYTILNISSGQLLSRQDLSSADYERLRKKRFTAYKKTLEYAVRFKETNEKLSAKDTETFLFQFAVEEYMSVTP